MSADHRYMRRALSLARRGMGHTSPNPMVGAVIVAGGKVVGEGWHRRAGAPHAEAVALTEAGAKSKGSTVYVNLEPCVHHGRTPPCVDALVEAEVAKVVIGMKDPDPRVSGRGVEVLRSAGIETEVGLEADRCRELASAYVVHRTKGRPEVTMKVAMTLDGRVAAQDGSSRWITSDEARREGHRMRSTSDAICVGIGTVLADDPELTTRLVRGPHPIRVVIDTGGRTPIGSKVLSPDTPTLIFTTEPSPELEAAGAEVVVVGRSQGRVDLKEVLDSLGRRGILSLLLEGGPGLASSFLAERLIDRFVFFVAPKLLGGSNGVMSWVAPSIENAEGLEITKVRRVGQDLMVIATPKGIV